MSSVITEFTNMCIKIVQDLSVEVLKQKKSSPQVHSAPCVITKQMFKYISYIYFLDFFIISEQQFYEEYYLSTILSHNLQLKKNIYI